MDAIRTTATAIPAIIAIVVIHASSLGSRPTNRQRPGTGAPFPVAEANGCSPHLPPATSLGRALGLGINQLRGPCATGATISIKKDPVSAEAPGVLAEGWARDRGYPRLKRA